MIPESAVEAAAAVLLGYTGTCSCHEGYTGRNLIDPDCSYHDVPPEVARLILEAAAPHMLAEVRRVENAAYRRGWCEGWRTRWRAQREARARAEQKKSEP